MNGRALPGTTIKLSSWVVPSGLYAYRPSEKSFSDLKIDRAGDGYTLMIGGSGVTGAESAQFSVKQKPLICLLGICIG